MDKQDTARFILALVFGIICGMIISLVVSELILGAEAQSEDIFDNEASIISRDDVMEYLKTDTEFIEEELEPKQWMDFEITAYCGCEICCDEWAQNRPLDEHGKQIVYGSSGIPLKEGVSIAADTSIYPIGTVIEIMGMGTYTVHDCGGAIRGNRIDIYFDNHSDALAFGRMMKLACVIEEG